MKGKQIEIPLSITNGDEYQSDNPNGFARERIERTHFYLYSIFNFIKSSAMNFNSGFAEESRSVNKFCWDLVNFCEIGDGLLLTIWENVSDMDFAEEGDQTVILAEQLSSILNNKNLPAELFNALQEGLDAVADAGQSKTLKEIEKSANFIENLLTDYHRAREVADG